MTEVSSVRMAWHPPPELLALGNQEVHVWRATLDQNRSNLRKLLTTLSEEERATAERFRFVRDYDHFVSRRGILRSILARHLDTEPHQLRFSYRPSGKPALATESGGNLLRFNTSHANGIGICAVTPRREIGVDLEYIRRDLAVEAIAERFYSPSEIAELHSLPREIQRQAFFSAWTRKEAYLKATGKGLSLSSRQFQVLTKTGGASGAVKHRLEARRCFSLVPPRVISWP